MNFKSEKTLMFGKNKLPELTPDNFEWDMWEANWGAAFGLNFSDCVDVKKVLVVIPQYAIGYCDSLATRIRPRYDSYAIMFEVDGFKFWFHVPKWWLDDNDDPVLAKL